MGLSDGTQGRSLLTLTGLWTRVSTRIKSWVGTVPSGTEGLQESQIGQDPVPGKGPTCDTRRSVPLPLTGDKHTHLNRWTLFDSSQTFAERCKSIIPRHYVRFDRDLSQVPYWVHSVSFLVPSLSLETTLDPTHPSR